MNFIAFDLSPQELINNPCTDKNFLADYVMYNYTVDINTIPGSTYWDKFITIYNANK
jgi:hypothetical protein